MKNNINNEIQNMYCNYINSFLLKLKGFDIPSLTYYTNQFGTVEFLKHSYTHNELIENMFDDNEHSADVKNKMCLAPTINVASKWIEVNFGYFIEVHKVFTNTLPEKFQFNSNYYYSYFVYNSYESKIEAYKKIIDCSFSGSKDEAYKNMEELGVYITEYDAYNEAIKSILEKI